MARSPTSFTCAFTPTRSTHTLSGSACGSKLSANTGLTLLVLNALTVSSRFRRPFPTALTHSALNPKSSCTDSPI